MSVTLHACPYVCLSICLSIGLPACVHPSTPVLVSTRFRRFMRRRWISGSVRPGRPGACGVFACSVETMADVVVCGSDDDDSETVEATGEALSAEGQLVVLPGAQWRCPRRGRHSALSARSMRSCGRDRRRVRCVAHPVDGAVAGAVEGSHRARGWQRRVHAGQAPRLSQTEDVYTARCRLPTRARTTAVH